jgi:hypothetical protein
MQDVLDLTSKGNESQTKSVIDVPVLTKSSDSAEHFPRSLPEIHSNVSASMSSERVTNDVNILETHVVSAHHVLDDTCNVLSDIPRCHHRQHVELIVGDFTPIDSYETRRENFR